MWNQNTIDWMRNSRWGADTEGQDCSYLNWLCLLGEQVASSGSQQELLEDLNGVWWLKFCLEFIFKISLYFQWDFASKTLIKTTLPYHFSPWNGWGQQIPEGIQHKEGVIIINPNPPPVSWKLHAMFISRQSCWHKLAWSACLVGLCVLHCSAAFLTMALPWAVSGHHHSE